MQGKKSCNQSAAPESAGERPEQEEEQERIGRMKQQADEMMPASVQAKELDIEHVRKQGEWVPIAGTVGRPRPFHIGPGQTAGNVRIERDVNWIIVVDEVVVDLRPEGRERGCGKQSADQQQPPTLLQRFFHEWPYCLISRAAAISGQDVAAPSEELGGPAATEPTRGTAFQPGTAQAVRGCGGQAAFRLRRLPGQ